MASNNAANSERGRALRVPEELSKSREKVLAELALSPAMNAAATVVLFGKGTLGQLQITETLEAMTEVAAKVRKGDLSWPEEMLVTQAAALNSIFTDLARRSGANMGEYIEASELYMRLALKAQAQCRATIETLAPMKNPPVVIARQANISNGPQQVNDGGLRAEKLETAPNKLLENEHDKRLDTGVAGASVRSHPALGQCDRAQRLVGRSIDEMAFDFEVIADVGVDRDKFL